MDDKRGYSGYQPTPGADSDADWVDEFCNSPVDLVHAGKQKPQRRVTPHARLKHKSRAALTAWRQAHGASVILLPSIVGRLQTVGGKEISVGKKGQSDDTLLIGKAGVLWGVVCPEYKAAGDYQRPAQKEFEAKCAAVGARYVLVRAPGDLVAALDKLAIDSGWRPF